MASARGRLFRAAAWVLAGSGFVAVLLGWSVRGGRGVLPALALWAALATVAVLVRGQLAARAVITAQAAVVEGCEQLASLMRIGLAPSAAVAGIARESPLFAEIAAVQAVGGDPVAALRRLSARPGASGLADLACAWQVASRSGASMTPAIEAMAAQLASTRDLRLVVAAELAAPRATSRLLACLPLVGVGVGFAMGGNPLRFLTESLPGQACLLAGVLLACAGVLWSELLARRAGG
jgi:tight adherence protein B